jgi:AcrR family transcriptional regulator
MQGNQVVTLLTKGRVRQKLRTRNKLVEVAAQLIGERKTFIIGDVADAVQVGRATTYRYFPKLESLTANAVLWQLTRIETSGTDQILDDTHPPKERLGSLVEMSDRSTSEYEVEQRTMSRLSFEATPGLKTLPQRSGFRTEMIDMAIGDLKQRLGHKLL